MLGRQYLGIIQSALDGVTGQTEAFSRAGKLIVDSAVKGGHLYVHDIENIIMYEAVMRSGGLSMARPLRVSDLPIIRAPSNDVAIVFTNEREFVEVEFVRALKKNGVRIIGVCPPVISSDAKAKLSHYSDVVIDNSLPEYGGVIKVPYFGKKLGQVDVVINSTIVFSICAEVIAEFLRRGMRPSTLQSIRTKGGVEHDARIADQFQRQGF